MLSLLREPDCIPESNDVEVRLYFDGLAGHGRVAQGVRTASGEDISQGPPIEPGPHVAIKLSWNVFEVQKEVELAAKEGGYDPPNRPDWEGMGWSWRQWYKAGLIGGKPALIAIDRQSAGV